MGLKDKLKVAAVGLAGVVMFSWMFGGDPITYGATPNEKVPNFSAQQYTKNCKNALSKGLAYICYPSAKFAAYLHNAEVE